MSALDQLNPLGRTGLAVPAVGFGTGSIGNRRRARSEMESIELVRSAHQAGFRYFDTAPMYGHGLAERRLGAGLYGLDGAGLVVSTKVGKRLVPATPGTFDTGIWVDVPAFEVVFDYSYDGALRCVEASLQRMLVDRLDIVYIHDPDHTTHGVGQPEVFAEAMAGARRALLDLKAQGVIGAVGLGCNDADVCFDAMDAGGFDVFLLARRYTLLDQAPLDDLLPRCVDERVSVIVGSAFASGILATGTHRGVAYYEERLARSEEMARVRAIEDVADRHGVPLAAAAIQFPLAHPAVACVLVGVGSRQQMADNVAFADFPIPPDFWAELRAGSLVRDDAPMPTGIGSEARG